MASHDGSKGAGAGPQPVPGAANHQTAGRRSSFSAWPPTFFGSGMSPPIRPQAYPSGMSPPAAHPLHSAYSPFGHGSEGAVPSQVPESTAASFSGIGLFRRFSTSGVPAARAQQVASPSTQPPLSPASELADALGRHARAEIRGDVLPHPKALDEVRGRNDPPSRPDSRMRNLMLSGQFLI